MRISRRCYDKQWRCPGWAGGGFKYAKRDRCDDGRLQINFEDRFKAWKFHRCNTCDVVALPSITRWLDPAWLRWSLSTAFSDYHH